MVFAQEQEDAASDGAGTNAFALEHRHRPGQNTTPQR